jgi:hypothetical protein
VSDAASRTWAVRVDGEILFQICGPDAEPWVRSVAHQRGGVVIYREDDRPTAANGWSMSGPWQEA